MTVLYNPPSGWKFGFPKVYEPSNPLEPIEHTLRRDGYPDELLAQGMAKRCRFWEESGMKNWDSVARRYVEHDTLPQETFGPEIVVGENGETVKLPEPLKWTLSDGTNLTLTGDSLTFNAAPVEFDNDDLRQVAPTATTERKDRGTYVQAFTGRFYPFDPSPADVRIEDIAHGLAHSARYNGAGKRYYSTAEHSVLIANWIWWRASAVKALCGLLHDAPEPLSGFGDVLRPVKDRAPIIKQTEDGIWRLAVAPKFGLPLDMPAVVHEADSRIIADEMAANMSDVDPSYRDPLGVELQFWTPDEAEAAFLETFRMLMAWCAPANDDTYPQQDREASAADRDYQLAKEEAA